MDFSSTQKTNPSKGPGEEKDFFTFLKHRKETDGVGVGAGGQGTDKPGRAPFRGEEARAVMMV